MQLMLISHHIRDTPLEIVVSRNTFELHGSSDQDVNSEKGC